MWLTIVEARAAPGGQAWHPLTSGLPIQRWTMFSSSVACALLSLICALGLLASIAVTFATQGRALLAACSFGSPELLALTPDCPFDPTRIYVSA